MGKTRINLAIDFGATNTLVATFTDEPQILNLSSISYNIGGTPLIPSIIGYYNNDKKNSNYVIGKETSNLDEGSIVRRMKRLAVSNRYKKINNVSVTYRQATIDFLSNLLNSIRYRYIQKDIDTVVFTVPVESFDVYRALIDEVCEINMIMKYHIIDESTAAALGYETAFSMTKPYMIIDFGGGTIDASVVKLTRSQGEFAVKVLGKAGLNFGGSDIDDWLLEDFIVKQGLGDCLVRYNSDEKLRRNIEILKTEVCSKGLGKIDYYNCEGDFTMSATYDYQTFNRLLETKGFRALIQNLIDNAVEQAYENGVKKREITEVLLVGGSSQIPLFKEILEANFPGKIKGGDPFGAVARGAANYLNGKVIEDFLLHHYALQYLDRAERIEKYETIVPKGTQFPAYNVKRLILSLPYSGQTKAALKIYEIATYIEKSEVLADTYYDSEGNFLVTRKTDQEIERKVCLNPDNSEFIIIDPPSIKGEDRFEVIFSVDTERLLRVQVRDLKTRVVLFENKIVARLQ